METAKERRNGVEGTEKIFEDIIAKKTSNVMKNIESQIQETKWIPRTRNKENENKAYLNQIAQHL